jgi:hypothetical protein
MRSARLRRRVYVSWRDGKVVVGRMLDLTYLRGKPIAVVSWVLKDGVRALGDYAELEAELLRPSSSTSTFWYGGIVDLGPAERACLSLSQ